MVVPLRLHAGEVCIKQGAEQGWSLPAAWHPHPGTPKGRHPRGDAALLASGYA